ncbi:PaaI family thioesterase [Comamonas composti]|uniref:PaaI family thioesterase n=1 Tax=Comamonas composti TaxID=408558 RepID=UPI00040175B7|nr:PaaI family thioesterase [Comamonas composti]
MNTPATEKNLATETSSTSDASELRTWIEQEQAVRTKLDAGSGPGVARPEQVMGLSGLQAMQAMLRGELPYASIAQTLDFMLLSVDRGEAVFQGRPGPSHLNPMGTIHGGWFATLLDSALGCAVQTCLPPGRGYTTAELGVNLVKALTPRVERVRAIGKVLHCGRQLATAEARLIGPDGTLYAHATTTCLVFELPKPQA